MNEEITSVNGRTEPTRVISLHFDNQTVHYLPKGIGKFFPNLNVLSVTNSKLRSLTQDVLKPLTRLYSVNFNNNDLESLDDNLFEFNDLRFVSFRDNKLKFIGENLFRKLEYFVSIRFASNICINEDASITSEILALMEKIKSQCSSCRNPKLVKEIEQLKKENAELKNQTNQQMIELNSANSTIIALKAENLSQTNLIRAHEMQRREYEDSIRRLNAVVNEIKIELKKPCGSESAKLKACDGNLNAVTEILFKMSDHRRIFKKLSAESFNLIVEVVGSTFTASEVIINSPGSEVNSVKFTNGSDVNIEATELCIDSQQTLFLPTNLGQHFPELQMLAVVSSGLMQIDSNVFGFMKNLKVLNLNSNKLQEIEPGTFDQLKLLETLDLCFNNLKFLTVSAVKGLANLQVLLLADNHLQVISSNILDPLKVLKSADFSNNDCITLSYPKVTLKEIKDHLNKDCIKTVEIECFTLGPDHNEVEEIQKKTFDCNAVNLTIKHPVTKISKLRNQNGFDYLTFSIIDQHVSFLPLELGNTFTKLNVLIVMQSKLTALNQRDFEGLKNLKSIIIVHNNLASIEPGVFDDVPQLEHLNLSSNHIQSLPAMAFVKLVRLKTLNLSDNKLQNFLFELLPSSNVIEEFYIQNNEIKKTDLALSMNLKKIKIIDLTDNICIDVKYDKGNTVCKTLTELFLALHACLI